MPSRRYDSVGHVYDVVSLEPLLYRKPRQRLLQLLPMAAGTTVLDLGCGTGLNFRGVQSAIGPTGRLLGVDASPSMLAKASRRVARAGWANVHLMRGDAADLLGLLDRAGLEPAGIDTILATFALSVFDDDRPVWSALMQLAADHRLSVGLADIGSATHAPTALRRVYRLLAALGGADPHRQPWVTLGRRGVLTAHELHREGHIHIATGYLQGGIIR